MTHSAIGVRCTVREAADNARFGRDVSTAEDRNAIERVALVSCHRLQRRTLLDTPNLRDNRAHSRFVHCQVLNDFGLQAALLWSSSGGSKLMYPRTYFDHFRMFERNDHVFVAMPLATEFSSRWTDI